MEIASIMSETPSPDFCLSSPVETGGRKPEIGFSRGIRGAHLPENLSEETPGDGEDDEGDGLKNEGEEEQLMSMTTHEFMAEAKRRMYSRSEMTALRFLDDDAQKRRWNGVFAGLEAIVAREYNGLRVTNDQKKGKKGNLLLGKFAGKKDDSGTVGEVLSLNKVEAGTLVSMDVTYGETLFDIEYCTNEEVSYFEDDNIGNYESDDDSDEEYDSIQRPAFLVEGEPDFESGSPLDGLEYLRRVRWEAAQIPKVKVAQLNLTKVCGEQTPYMPIIPDIAECPQNLLPSKHWEDTFLTNFSMLRQAFSEFDTSHNQSVLNKDSPKLIVCRQKPTGGPTLTAISGMGAASRAFILRSSISSFETSSSLSRADCLWLYALCATIDAPLDADTCASVRSLLRKCSDLMAAKSELDDEVAMLTILIVIAGKYFRQSENR